MSDYKDIAHIIDNHRVFLIIQADNPDADSLASALALEQILGELGKTTALYCSVDMPEYLRYLEGWDRVSKDIPSQFEASIIVDTSTVTLLEKLQESSAQSWVASKPVIVLDHHKDVQADISYATVTVNDPSKVSTGELIYDIAKQLSWPLDVTSMAHIMTSILADSMGLATENTSAATYRVMAELVEGGVNRPALEEQRRAYNKMAQKIFRYKGDLIDRTEFIDDVFAWVVIPQAEINEFSPLYNPAPLIQTDHLMTANVLISIVVKLYDSGRITAAIRANQGAPIASKVAESFGGGGHAYAAGFKLENASIDEVKSQCIEQVRQLLNEARS